MSDRIPVEVKSDQLKRTLYKLLGAAYVREKFAEHEAHSKTPGFALASALLESVIADFRAEMAGEALREASKAGIDITKTKGIFTSFKGDKPVIEAEMYDLADDRP